MSLSEKVKKLRNKSLLKKMFTGTASLLNSDSKEKKDEAKAKARERATRSDRKELIEQLRKKASSHMYQANIRIITAGNSLSHAQSLLAGIESTFNQFANPQGNAFEFVRESKKAPQQKLIHNFTYRIFNKKHAIQLGSKELTSLLHFHKKNEGSSDMLETSNAVTAAASSKAVATAGDTETLGVDITPGKIFFRC